MFIMLPILILVGLFAFIFLVQSFYLVKQAETVIVERLGKYHRTLHPGLHIVIPFIDSARMVHWSYVRQEKNNHYVRYSMTTSRIDLREAVYDFPKQNVITKDNVTMEINALLYYRINDPHAAVYEVSNLPEAIEKLTQTTLRNVIGSLDLDETLVSRDQINDKLTIILDEATDKWGVKVNRVELQEVNPPHDIRQAMEKQMRAERDRRAIILESEGKKQAAILEAEGEKQADILNSEGKAQAAVISAEAEATARLKIALAEGEAIARIREHLPAGIDPTQYMVALKYIAALPEMTKGKDNKLVVIPYEASSVMGSLAGIKKLFQEKL